MANFKIIIGKNPDWDFSAIAFDVNSQQEAVEKYKKLGIFQQRMVAMFGAKAIAASEVESSLFPNKKHTTKTANQPQG